MTGAGAAVVGWAAVVDWRHHQGFAPPWDWVVCWPPPDWVVVWFHQPPLWVVCAEVVW